jgi:hypothetical protein
LDKLPHFAPKLFSRILFISGQRLRGASVEISLQVPE